MREDTGDVTGLLRAWRSGDQKALERLVPLVDGELRRRAKRYLQKTRPQPALETTSLLDEAYVRLLDAKRLTCEDRVHFFALCASIIRGILVDRARAYGAAKRGYGVPPQSLDAAPCASPERASELVAVDDALAALAKVDPRKGRVVELRFFGGLGIEEIAAVLKISPDSVKRDWRLAKLWLARELSRGARGES